VGDRRCRATPGAAPSRSEVRCGRLQLDAKIAGFVRKSAAARALRWAIAMNSRIPIAVLAIVSAAGCSAAASSGAAEISASALGTSVTGVTFETQLLGNYLGAENDGGGTVIATATVAKGWETFTLHDQNGGALESGDDVFIEAGNGDFFQAANGGGTTLDAASHNPEVWETFRVVKASGTGAIASGDVVGLEAVTKSTWVSAANGGGGTVYAYGASMGAWEKLIIGIGSASVADAGADSAVDAHADTGADAAPSGFAHPGVLVTKAQLDFVKAKISANASPWKGAMANTMNDFRGSLTYTASPVPVVECGAYSMNPDIGCSAEKDDAAAAYTQALLWYFTGNTTYAKNAVAIMNAWSAILTGHTASNAPLQSAWSGSLWPRAGEIIRYTYGGWATADIAKFSSMLKNVYLPEVDAGAASNGNWELSMAEATIAMGVFLDNQTEYAKGLALWRRRVPAYLYLTSDGALPVPPPTGDKNSESALIGYWYSQTTFVNGLCQETCRDFGHVQYGIASMTNAAETARIQGVDLYGEQSSRITAGYEFHANYLNGASVPAWLCGGSLTAVTPDPMWEIGYNEYSDRDGVSMPNTTTLLARIRPTSADHMMIWETLTHAEVGSVGIP
jgi:hypothetical protein